MTSIPTVHRNGTSKDILLNDNETARDAVRTAMAALSAAAPNPRDFYVQADPLAFTKAAKTHADRMLALQRVYAELTEIVEGVFDQ